jgi:hypothetical protein
VSAIITLYKNGSPVGTVNCVSGGTWNIIVPSISPADVFYAKAQATGESQCLQSNNITAGCTATPASPTITCASTKGITGTLPLGSTLNIYQVTTSNNSPVTTPLTTGLVYTNNATDRTFNYFGTNPQTGNACQGQNGILATNSTYMLVANNNGCLSAPTFICITGSSQGSWNYITANTIMLSTPVYAFNNTVSGTGAVSGQLLRLFINNQYVSAVTATGSSFTFTGLTLSAGDVLKVYAQTGSACVTVSSSFTVSCYTQAPVITTNSAGNLIAGSLLVSGTSAYPGASISLYKGTSPSGTLAGTATAGNNGSWSVGGLLLLSGDRFYATQSVNGCASSSSVSANVLGQTTVCPAFGSLTYTESASSVGGTSLLFSGTIRLYLDGIQIGSTTVSNAFSWSVAVNTSYANTLYPGGILSVTAQSTGNAETTCASIASVSCSSPSQPVVSPLISVINVGQSVNFTVSNVASNTWYAVMDNFGSSYATSIYTSTTNSLSFTSKTFTTPGIYTLNVSADKLSGCPKSYQTSLITVNNIVLPVHFIDVKARRENSDNVIAWEVDNEVDVAGYVIEHSSDGQVFVSIGRIKGKNISGRQSYSFTDMNAPTASIIYYRVKQTDIDGGYEYSKIVSLSQVEHPAFKLYPNPSHGNFTVTVDAKQAGVGNINIVNAQGQIILTRKMHLQKGMNNVPVTLSIRAAGLHQVQVVTGDAVCSAQLIVL